MATISITPEALEAIKATLSELDNAAPSPGPDGLVRVMLDRVTVNRLDRLRSPDESYSDVIMKLAKG
jgi:predicted CopG family antitoxin